MRIEIASLGQKWQQFCWMGRFYLGLELQREGSALQPAQQACFLININHSSIVLGGVLLGFFLFWSSLSSVLYHLVCRELKFFALNSVHQNPSYELSKSTIKQIFIFFTIKLGRNQKLKFFCASLFQFSKLKFNLMLPNKVNVLINELNQVYVGRRWSIAL